MTDAIEKVNYTHDAMIDLIIENPSVQQVELARHFGYTQGWISQIMSADAFQERLAARKKELIDPDIIASIDSRFKALTHRAQEVLFEKLEAAPTADLALKVADLSARALGYGAKVPGASVQLNQQFVVHMPSKAANGEEWLAARHKAGERIALNDTSVVQDE